LVTTPSGQVTDISPGSYTVTFRSDGTVLVDYGIFPEKVMDYEILENQEIKLKPQNREVIIIYILENNNNDLTIVGDLRVVGADKEQTTVLQRVHSETDSGSMSRSRVTIPKGP
jgi:hypothetical protein